MKKNLINVLIEQGFSKTLAQKIERECGRTFRIQNANILFKLGLYSPNGWTIVRLDNGPGEISFGQLRELSK